MLAQAQLARQGASQCPSARRTASSQLRTAAPSRATQVTMSGLLRGWQRLSLLSRVTTADGAIPALSRGQSTRVYAAAATDVDERPKKPPTAYNAFVKDNFAKIAAENPDLKGATGLASKLGQKWKELSEADKAVYQKEAAELKAAYEAKYPPGTRAPRTPKAKGEPKPKSDKPKKAPSAYNNFVKKRIPEIKSSSSITVPEAMKAAGKEWKQLSQEEKDAYKTSA